MSGTVSRIDERVGAFLERDHTIVRWGITLLIATALSWLFRDHLPSAAGLHGSAPAPAVSTQVSGSPTP